MSWKNLFDAKESQETIERINALTPETQHLWGKMDVAQMLAHCNVAYELVYTDKHPKPKGFKKFMIKLFAKNLVVGPKPYKKNLRTAPMFLIADERDFEKEKARLVEYLQKTQQLGASHFNGKSPMLSVTYQQTSGILCFLSTWTIIYNNLVYRSSILKSIIPPSH